MGGLCGGLLTGFLANDFVSGSPEKRGVFYGKGDQIWIQVLPRARPRPRHRFYPPEEKGEGRLGSQQPTLSWEG